MVVEKVAVDFLEIVAEGFVDNEELHLFSDFPGVGKEAFTACTFASEAGDFRILMLSDTLDFFIFGNVIGVVSMGDGIPNGKDEDFSVR